MAGYRTQSRDTSLEAERFLVGAWQRMQPWEKARQISAACRAAARFQVAGLRLRSPGASAEELKRQAAALRLGPELAARIAREMPL